MPLRIEPEAVELLACVWDVTHEPVCQRPLEMLYCFEASSRTRSLAAFPVKAGRRLTCSTSKARSHAVCQGEAMELGSCAETACPQELGIARVKLGQERQSPGNPLSQKFLAFVMLLAGLPLVGVGSLGQLHSAVRRRHAVALQTHYAGCDGRGAAALRTLFCQVGVADGSRHDGKD